MAMSLSGFVDAPMFPDRSLAPGFSLCAAVRALGPLSGGGFGGVPADFDVPCFTGEIRFFSDLTPLVYASVSDPP